MSAFTVLDSFISNAAEVGEVLAEKNGLTSLQNTLNSVGYAAGAAATFAEENPWEAAAALLAGVAVTTVLAPELIAAGAVELAGSSLMVGAGDALAATLVEGGVDAIVADSISSNAISLASSVVTNTVAEQTGEQAIKALWNVSTSLISALGGTQITMPIANAPSSVISAVNLGSNNGALILPDPNSSASSALFWSLPSNSGPGQLTIGSANNPAVSLNNGTWSNIDLSSALDGAVVANVADNDGTSKTITLNINDSTTITDFSGLNDTGAITNVDQENPDGTSTITIYNSDGSTIATSYSGPDGTGSVTEVDQENADTSGSVAAFGQSLTYAAGDIVDISIGAAGDVQVDVTPKSGPSTETLDLTTGGVAVTVGSSNLLDSLPNTNIIIDASGNLSFASPESGGGTSTLTVPGNDSGGTGDTFTIGPDTIAFSVNSLTSVSGSGSAYDFTYGSGSSATTGSVDFTTGGAAAVSLSNVTISLGSGSTTTVDGADDTINISTNGSISGSELSGSTITTSAGDDVSILDGQNNVINASEDSIKFVIDNGTASNEGTVVGDGNTVNFYGNQQGYASGITLAGSDTISITSAPSQNIYANGPAAFTLQGNGLTETYSGNDVNFGATSGSTGDTINFVNGAGLGFITLNSATINAPTGSSLGIGGAGDAVDASGSTLTIFNDGETSLTGDNDTVQFYENATVSLSPNASDDDLYLAAPGLSDTIEAAEGDNFSLGDFGDYDSSWIIDAGNNNTIAVTGDGDTINAGNGDDFVLGNDGEVNINLGSGATDDTVTTDEGAVNSTGNGDISVDGGGNTIDSSGDQTVTSSDNTVDFDDGDSDDPALVGNNNTVHVQQNLIVTITGNANTISLSSGDTFTAQGTNDLITVPGGGTLDIAITGNANTVSLSSGDTFTAQGTNNLIIVPASSTLDITGFGLDNAIELKGQNVTSAMFNAANNALSITGDGGSTATLFFPAGFQQSDFVVSDGEVEMACFQAGTRISTGRGEVPVEDLAVGDLVHALGAGLTPIKWIGYRQIDCSRHPRPEHVWPVRVRAHGFAAGRPHRDLWLSPDHAVFVDGILIPVRQLINRTTIVQVPMEQVTYFHVELAHHDVLTAEGLPVESYLDTGNRAAFANAGASMMLHPDFAVPAAGFKCRDRDACAPFATRADQVEPVWRRLAVRAAELGHSLPAAATDNSITTDAELRLEAGGRVLWPLPGRAGSQVFAVPPGTDAVRLVSRAAAPSASRPWLEDRRRLGVSVGRIKARCGTTLAEVPVDHPALAQGWHDVERAGARMWRWTDGNSYLPIPPGTTTLEIVLAGLAEYPAAESAPLSTRGTVTRCSDSCA